jgi:hypothetical protein
MAAGEMQRGKIRGLQVGPAARGLPLPAGDHFGMSRARCGPRTQATRQQRQARAGQRDRIGHGGGAIGGSENHAVPRITPHLPRKGDLGRIDIARGQQDQDLGQVRHPRWPGKIAGG